MDIKKKTAFIERTDSMQAYLHDMSKLKVMTPQREKELFDEYHKTTDNNRKLEIRNEVIEGNQRFIFAIAKRYATDELLNDLISVANLGAIEAFEDYDASTGNRFTTIAEYYIRRAINAYLNKDNLMVRPSNNTKIAPRVKKIEAAFYAKNGRSPMADEVAEMLRNDYGIDVKNEEEINGATIDYIEDAKSSDDNDYTMEDASDYSLQYAEHNEYINTMEHDNIHDSLEFALNSLSEREATIVKMSTGTCGYDKEYKDAEISEVLGLSSERVRQLKKGAMDKLAAMLKSVVMA